MILLRNAIRIQMAKLDYVGVRLPERNLDKIDELIEVGEFDSRSSFIRYAVKEMLEAYNGDTVIVEGSDGPRIKRKLSPDNGRND